MSGVQVAVSGFSCIMVANTRCAAFTVSDDIVILSSQWSVVSVRCLFYLLYLFIIYVISPVDRFRVIFHRFMGTR